MKNKKLGRKGLIWGLPKIMVLLGAIMLFTVLWSLYTNFIKINAMDSGIRESRNIARIIDEIGSSPSLCEIGYKSPERLSNGIYEIEIVPKKVIISLNDTGMNYSASFISEIGDNISTSGGTELRIKKDHRSIKIAKDGM
ncbi:MAG: hypothetical protein B6U86_00370 [Candidatus Altiarchaeales archaeon ex4484_43]|nr:MAG: hypothetical protein B6U86_00370 [Candidatus Altiarchaeales archaeon ex4484_43]